MTGFESLLGMAGDWFGFVGACVAGSGSACRPFLAFVALTAAAGAALALLVLAFVASRKGQVEQGELSQQLKREPQTRQPVRLIPASRPAGESAAVSSWQLTA